MISTNHMKTGSIRFLQVVLVLIGAAVLAAMLVEPWFEGVNAGATSYKQIYFDDLFLAYAYTASIAFFVALYQGFKLLGSVARGQVFSDQSIKALRTIKNCAMLMVAFVFGAELFIFFNHGNDDMAGGVMVGLVIAVISSIAAAAAAVFERALQSAVDLKAENDLTV